MPPKGAAASASAKGSKKNAKPVFDPFERVCTHTTVVIRDPASANPSSPHGDAGNGGDGGSAAVAAEFTASALVITPPLPRTEVAMQLRFRLTATLNEGDTIYLHLPKFNGPPAQQFGLESTAQSGATDAAFNGMEGVSAVGYFRGFWSGTSAKVLSAVHQVEFKRGKKGGAPPKQVIVLECIKAVPANVLIVFGIPRALGIVTPDKLPANSSKLKLEGPVVWEAEGHRVLKQIILSSTEVKKLAVVEELAAYEHSIATVAREGGLSAADRQLCEQLSLEELDQTWRAAQFRRRYPVPMTWTAAQEVSVAYEAAGSFVKRIVQNAIACIKDFDPLAVHKEVARNWGVKVAAVVVFDDYVAAQWTALYPGIPRCSLFAACLLTMEPEDVGRAFPSVTELPPRSIADELMSAFRMRAGLDAPTGTTTTTTAAAAAPDTAAAGGDGATARAAAMAAEMLRLAGAQNRCGATLNKWAALITALLPATLVAECDPSASSLETMEQQRASLPGSPRAESREQAESAFLAAAARVRRTSRLHSSAGAAATAAALSSHRGAVATLAPPPTLYVGYRDVPAEERRALQALQQGEWFVLPFQVVARQSLPYASVTPSSQAAAGASDDAADGAAAAEDDKEEVEDGAAAAIIPDNAVVVELRNVVEGLELADVSLSPYNRAWLLPLATSGRVVTVEEDQHEVLHVVVEMVGSLVGQVNDAFLPQSDRSVATVILSKYLAKAEQTESYVAAFSALTALYARRNERRRLHPPTLIRAQYLSHYNAAMRASAAKYNVEESERVEWQVRTHDAQLLDEGVVKPAVWEPIQKKYMTTVEQFFLGHSRTLQKLEEGTLSVDLGNYTIDYGGKGPRALRRVVDKVYVTHEAAAPETAALLEERAEQYAKQLAVLDNKLGISPSTAAAGAGDSAKKGSVAGSKKKKG